MRTSRSFVLRAYFIVSGMISHAQFGICDANRCRSPCAGAHGGIYHICIFHCEFIEGGVFTLRGEHDVLYSRIAVVIATIIGMLNDL